MLFGIGCWAKYGFSWIWIIALAVGILGMVIRFVAFYVMPSIRFDKEPKFKDEYILSFNDDGLNFHTEHLDSKLDWNYYYKAWETDKFYLLFYGKSLFTIVPQRAFDDDEHERSFRSIISKNLREGIERI